MADVREMRIFSAEQIEVPQQLPEILKNFSKEVIRNNPEDLVKFSRDYFEAKAAEHARKAPNTVPKWQPGPQLALIISLSAISYKFDSISRITNPSRLKTDPNIPFGLALIQTLNPL